MATITITVVETGFPNAQKVFTFNPDSHLDRMIASYQSAANTSINGTATRNQVLLYWAQTIIDVGTANTKQFETQQAIAAVPPVSPITPA